MKNVHFKQLEQFWVKGNKERGRIENIEEINKKKKKGSIKVIVLKQNSIKNIEKLVDIISSFPKLEKLDIRDNEIPRNEIQTVLNKIKEKRFENLKIIGLKNSYLSFYHFYKFKINYLYNEIY